MKILLIMDPGIPVPPVLYGGHERLVALFAEEYKKMGHEVTLLAGPGSYCSGLTVPFGTNDLKRSKGTINKEILFVWKYLYKNRNKFDLIHNFGRLIYLLPVLHHRIKKIMTYGRPVSTNGIRIINSLAVRNLAFTACSDYCVSTGNVAGQWHTVYNAIDFSRYQLRDTVDVKAPLMFLGRLDRIKGVHTAIEVAKATGRQLIIAGNIPNTPDNLNYFKSEIEPKFDDQIKYVGAINDAEKNIWLGKAKALLFPIEWDEPFGIVMIEAMACGTPVIGFNRGSVPEVIENGVNGFVVDNATQMIESIDKIKDINRFTCRETAKNRYGTSLIAKQYLHLFNQEP